MDILNNYMLSSKDDQFNISLLIEFIYKNMENKAYHNRLHYKKYENDSLIQLFTESSLEYTKWEIYNICRSIIFSGDTGKIITFSHPNIEYLTYEDAQQYFDKNTKFTESHEGTLISVFNYNNKWYYSTRRHIDMYKTHKYVYNVKSELSYGQMFEEALNKLNITINEFENRLDKNLQYYFELVHYQNSFNISYTNRFGEKYAKLFLLYVKNEKHEIVDNSVLFEFISNLVNPIVSLEEVKIKLEDKLENKETEGYIFERIDNNGVKHLCKVLHPVYYTIMKYSPGFKTLQEQYIYLYQKDLLKEYVTTNNKINYVDNIETVGLLSNFFSYIGQRLLDIYYKFNNNNMVHRNESLFKKIFMEDKKYPIIFYTLGRMKGIHKNKQLNIIEMKKLLKYYTHASDVWKISNEISKFEVEEVGVIAETTNKLVRYFM